MSASMIEAAQHNGLSRLVQGDAHVLPFRSSCFGAVLFAESVGYLQIEDAIRETARVLTRGGRLVVTTYPTHSRVHSLYRQLSEGELRRYLAAGGFAIRSMRFLRTTYGQVKILRSQRGSTLLYIAAAKVT
jgi:ubiquinone/menaquinone biosynthesis C-methylase UbiE